MANYTVWRCQGVGCSNFGQIASISAQNTSYEESGLQAATIYLYYVKAVNSYGQSSYKSNTASATTLSQQEPSVPTITSSTTASGTIGIAFSYQITATNSPTSYGATGLPAGLTANTGTGAISGTPTASGSFNVGLSATNSAGTGTATLAMTVNSSSSGAQISATPSSVSFGTVVNGNTNSQSIRLTNAGGTTLTFSQVSVSGAGFGETGLSTSTSIGPGGSATFNATFDPSSAGAVSGSIRLTTNATPSPLVINLSGTGQTATYSVGANPASMAFGNVIDGTTSSQTTTITNSGNSSVAISGVTASGAGFSASGISSGTVLKASQSATLTVTFAPTTGGTVSGASVSITSNATNSPAIVSLSGTGAHSAVLQWTASTTSGVTYNVYRGTSPGGELTTALNTSAISTTTYTDTAITPGQQYYYTVKAVDSAGNSPASNEVSALIPSP